MCRYAEKEEMQLKSTKKNELDFWDKSNDYAILAFSAYHISVTRNEGQIQNVDFFPHRTESLTCMRK